MRRQRKTAREDCRTTANGRRQRTVRGHGRGRGPPAAHHDPYSTHSAAAAVLIWGRFVYQPLRTARRTGARLRHQTRCDIQIIVSPVQRRSDSGSRRPLWPHGPAAHAVVACRRRVTAIAITCRSVTVPRRLPVSTACVPLQWWPKVNAGWRVSLCTRPTQGRRGQ